VKETALGSRDSRNRDVLGGLAPVIVRGHMYRGIRDEIASARPLSGFRRLGESG
jgi:hypothetical protein